MTQQSFYGVLLVDQSATLDEIKLAFKRRALQVHPDKGGSKEEFLSTHNMQVGWVGSLCVMKHLCQIS